PSTFRSPPISPMSAIGACPQLLGHPFRQMSSPQPGGSSSAIRVAAARESAIPRRHQVEPGQATMGGADVQPESSSGRANPSAV
ncbi:MAG: hypothetical protein ACOC8E_08900, partial [Planctomycetota bacterium]